MAPAGGGAQGEGAQREGVQGEIGAVAEGYREDGGGQEDDGYGEEEARRR